MVLPHLFGSFMTKPQHPRGHLWANGLPGAAKLLAMPCALSYRSPMWKAVLIMFVAMSCIPAGDAAGKILTGQIGASPIYVTASRFLIGTLCVLPFLPNDWREVFLDWRIWLRGLLLPAGIFSIQTALATAPLADVFAVFFVGPAFSTLLAVVFLRERLDALRWALLGLGFFGVLVVVRPGFGMAPGLEWAAIAGLFYGAFLAASRWLGAIAPAQTLLFSQLFIGAIVTLPFGITSIPDLSPQIVKLTFISAVLSMLGNGLLILAYRMRPASQLAPLVYFQLIAAVILGWLQFKETPDIVTWIGLALILTAGICSALRSARLPLAARADRG